MTVRRKAAEKLSGNAGSGKMLQNRAPNEVQFSISRSIMRHSLEMTTAIQAAKSAGAFLKKHFMSKRRWMKPARMISSWSWTSFPRN